MYGLQPGGHHATNLILHALNSMLVFLVLRQLTGAFWRSAAVAAFFAWHPLHVEVAAWIAERKGLLCAFFWLLTLWAYARYAEEFKVQGSKFKFFMGRLVFFALALMSKPVAVTLPLILLLLDWWPLGRLAATPDGPPPNKPCFYWPKKFPSWCCPSPPASSRFWPFMAKPCRGPHGAGFRSGFVSSRRACRAFAMWPNRFGRRTWGRLPLGSS
jgi:hypothetical protein